MNFNFLELSREVLYLDVWSGTYEQEAIDLKFVFNSSVRVM